MPRRLVSRPTSAASVVQTTALTDFTLHRYHSEYKVLLLDQCSSSRALPSVQLKDNSVEISDNFIAEIPRGSKLHEILDYTVTTTFDHWQKFRTRNMMTQSLIAPLGAARQVDRLVAQPAACSKCSRWLGVVTTARVTTATW